MQAFQCGKLFIQFIVLTSVSYWTGGRGEGEEENAQREKRLPNKILTLSGGFMSALCK